MGVMALTWPLPSASIAFSSQAEVAAVSQRLLVPSSRESCLLVHTGHWGQALLWVPVPSQHQQDVGAQQEISLQETCQRDAEVPVQRG